MRSVWLLVAIVGCAPRHAEKVEEPNWIPHPEQDTPTPPPPVELIPPPAIDLTAFTPDFHDELRWPLTPMNHPVMEPKFPIAQEFAQPGVAWTELCSDGVTNRYGGDKELLSYLRGWCKAIEGDTDAACSNLAPLLHSTKPRIEAAVRNDLANILAQNHADKAEHLIQVHQLRDIGMLDLLAANFVEVGTPDDALAINRNAMDSDDYASAADKCMRWTRHIVLSGDKLSPLLKQVESYATVLKNPDRTCVAEYRKLNCWAKNDCNGVNGTAVTMLDRRTAGIIQDWNRTRTAERWRDIAREQIEVLWSPSIVFSEQQLAELTVVELENAVHLELWDPERGCSVATLGTLDAAGRKLEGHLDDDLAARMKALRQRCLDRH